MLIWSFSCTKTSAAKSEATDLTGTKTSAAKSEATDLTGTKTSEAKSEATDLTGTKTSEANSEATDLTDHQLVEFWHRLSSSFSSAWCSKGPRMILMMRTGSTLHTVMMPFNLRRLQAHTKILGQLSSVCR